MEQCPNDYTDLPELHLGIVNMLINRECIHIIEKEGEAFLVIFPERIEDGKSELMLEIEKMCERMALESASEEEE